MASRRESAVWERKGSMLRARVEKFGARGVGRLVGSSEREDGIWWGEVGGLGRVWRKEVRRCELWIWRGSSRRMSWYRREDFWRLSSCQWSRCKGRGRELVFVPFDSKFVLFVGNHEGG